MWSHSWDDVQRGEKMVLIGTCHTSPWEFRDSSDSPLPSFIASSPQSPSLSPPSVDKLTTQPIHITSLYQKGWMHSTAEQCRSPKLLGHSPGIPKSQVQSKDIMARQCTLWHFLVRTSHQCSHYWTPSTNLAKSANLVKLQRIYNGIINRLEPIPDQRRLQNAFQSAE
jgi:hypothetical protein